MRLVSVLCLAMLWCPLFSQTKDTLYFDSTINRKVMVYDFPDRKLYYPKPKPFGFLWKVPRTYRDIAVESFSKKSLPAWGAVVGATGLLLVFDQQLVNGVQQFSRYINLDNHQVYHKGLSFNLGNQEVTIYEPPGNLNTFIYQLGEGLPSLLLAGGLAAYGNIKNDYRARSTASQITQAFVTMGVTTQLLKRVFGRESPRVATQDGGTWRPFPNWGDYQSNVAKYDAVPSGHMATMMSTLVVISENYPEKRWIKPLGYSLIGLVGLSMMNNGVHWAGDYPLAIGLGYVVGKVTVKMNRWVKGK